jgi:hypothetical protein
MHPLPKPWREWINACFHAPIVQKTIRVDQRGKIGRVVGGKLQY